MSEPKISIIVPVYNAEKYLHQCVDSILAQTYKDFEVLLIDDGSKDGSGAICDEYAVKDDRVRVFHKENGGVSSARNIGLDNARGEWVSFVDSDDWVNSGMLNDFISIDKEADLVSCSGENNSSTMESLGLIEWGEHILIGKHDIEQYIVDVRNDNSTGFLAIVWGKRYRRDIIEQQNLRFPLDIDFKEDEIFNLYYLQYVNRLVTTIYIGYHYRIVEGSLSHKELNPYTLTRLCAYWDVLLDKFTKELQEDIQLKIVKYAMQSIYKVNIRTRYHLAKQILELYNVRHCPIPKIAMRAAKCGSLAPFVLLAGTYVGTIKRLFIK